jgi:TetR/AcrR family transcriptional regulator, cholesterol catabolism regulator
LPRKPKSRDTANGAGSRRDEILAIAARLFSEKGFEATTVRDIGDAAGILPGSLYHHFATKEEILDELLSAFVAQLVPSYEAIVAGNSDPRAALRELIVVALQESLDHSSAMSIISHERKFFSASPRFRYVEEALQDVNRIWYGVLQDGVRSGVFRADLNLNLALRMVLSFILSTALWYRRNSHYPREAVIETQTSLILRGLEAAATDNNNRGDNP